MERDEDGVIKLSEYDKPRRHVTDFNATGQSVFSPVLAEEVTPFTQPVGLLYDVYKTTRHPVQMNNNIDLEDFAAQPSAQMFPPLPPGVTIARTCDFLPGSPPVMHRSVTLDFGVVVQGEIELTLDSGEKRVLRQGGHIVQRGTMHACRNPHPTQTCRMFFVILPIEPMDVNGEELGEMYSLPRGMKTEGGGSNK